jgi:hypothetical protein
MVPGRHRINYLVDLKSVNAASARALVENDPCGEWLEAFVRTLNAGMNEHLKQS